MLIERFLPKDSKHFPFIAKLSQKLDGIIGWKPLSWIPGWLMYAAGLNAHKSLNDRYYYWDGSSWLPGVLIVIFISILFAFLLKKEKLDYEKADISISALATHTGLCFVLFILGWGISDLFSGLAASLAYISVYLSIVMVYAIKIYQEGDSLVYIVKSRRTQITYFLVAIILVLFSIIRGFSLDDPVISTASMVILPFYVVGLFGKHGRHIQRARFYPVFTMAMFLAFKESWLFLLCFILFYALRHYYYFRYKTIFPSFGVYFDEEKPE